MLIIRKKSSRYMNLSPPSLRKLEGYEDFSSVESRNMVKKNGVVSTQFDIRSH